MNSNCSGIEKVGVKSIPGEIIADLDPGKRVNLVNSIISESPWLINLGLLSFDVTGKVNIAFTPSTRDRSLNNMRKGKFKADRRASRHDFRRVSETTAYSNHIKNSELETREFFEQETENIPVTQQTILVFTLNKNPLTLSTDSSEMKKGTNWM